MAYTVPTVEPVALRAGDTAKWLKSLADYPASDGWVLTYELVKAGTRYTFNAGASGADHLVNVSAATTAGWSAGDYQWAAKVTLAGEVHTTATGAITILPSFTTAVDARSHARKTLAALEAWIEGRDMGVAEYEIAGRRMKSIPIADLLVLRDRYRRDVTNEDNAQRVAAGLPTKGRLQVRFGKPT